MQIAGGGLVNFVRSYQPFQQERSVMAGNEEKDGGQGNQEEQSLKKGLSGSLTVLLSVPPGDDDL